MQARWIAAVAALVSAIPSHAQQAASPVAPVVNVDPNYAPVLPGSWAYSPVSGGSEAVYRDTGQRPQLFIRCTRATRQVTISKPASAAAAALNVWTSSSTRNVAARFDPAGGLLSVDLAVHDRLLDGIAFSRGRIAVRVPGQAQLVVPSWPEALRPIEDCRS